MYLLKKQELQAESAAALKKVDTIKKNVQVVVGILRTSGQGLGSKDMILDVNAEHRETKRSTSKLAVSSLLPSLHGGKRLTVESPRYVASSPNFGGTQFSGLGAYLPSPAPAYFGASPWNLSRVKASPSPMWSASPNARSPGR